jgi:hypothetical protein
MLRAALLQEIAWRVLRKTLIVAIPRDQTNKQIGAYNRKDDDDDTKSHRPFMHSPDGQATAMFLPDVN